MVVFEGITQCLSKGIVMNITDVITTVIGSGLFAGLIAYFSTQHSNIRSHKVKYITEERQNWCKDIKENISKFCSSD
jgi:glycopeptide antibiotics resistance protein